MEWGGQGTWLVEKAADGHEDWLSTVVVLDKAYSGEKFLEDDALPQDPAGLTYCTSSIRIFK